jgi:hypothetical protein
MKTPQDPEAAETVQTTDSPAVAPVATCSDVWEYSEYRATLRLNGKFFAFMTPDGGSALSAADAAKLLAALNRPNS